MAKRQLLLLSSSNVHGYELLQHSRSVLDLFMKRNNTKEILFVPYAQRNYDEYTAKISQALEKFDYQTIGIHKFANPIEAVKSAKCLFIGGGNTFLLLKTLYELNLVDAIRESVLQNGLPYIGSSAGTNVATVSINTTNDMPIVYPPSFNALNLVPFNINPHYLDADLTSKHKGETRETRLKEFHEVNATPVLGLREGTCLLVTGDEARLLGDYNGRLFKKNATPEEISPNTDLSYLLKWT